MAWERVENDGLEVLTEFGEQILEWASRNPEAAKALVEGKAWVIKPLPDQIGDYFNKVYDGGKIVPNEFSYDGRVARLDRPEGDGR